MKERIDECVKHCRSFNVAIDVGAHEGLYSIEMSRHFGRVYSFEPISMNFIDLERNTRNYPSINVYNFGVSDSERQEVFDISGKSNGFHISNNATVAEVCNLVTLDDFFEKQQDVDFIKIDVEGHEAAVLRGAQRLIRVNRPVIMIEEKFDPELTASKLLESWGYAQVWRKKRDRVFVCKSS